jgi:hypothetical protein
MLLQSRRIGLPLLASLAAVLAIGCSVTADNVTAHGLGEEDDRAGQ